MIKDILHTAKVIFAILILLAFGSGLGYMYGITRIPHLRNFQRRIGCKQIDCKVGPSWKKSEVQARWGQAYLEQTGILMY